MPRYSRGLRSEVTPRPAGAAGRGTRHRLPEPTDRAGDPGAVASTDTDGAPPRSNPVLVTVGRTASHIGSTPLRAAGTTGRGIHLAVDVLRYAVMDCVTLRLPVEEFLWQAWVLLKVTATPAVLMAIPFGAMVTVVTSGLVSQVGDGELRNAWRPTPQKGLWFMVSEIFPARTFYSPILALQIKAILLGHVPRTASKLRPAPSPTDRCQEPGVSCRLRPRRAGHDDRCR
jgi:hypothetical protein